MREIRSPLDGILSPFAARSVDAYAVQGLSPLLVADFTTPYYRKAGSTSTFDSTFTHSRAGNATMVDSDGLIKWAPHNLALNSAAPATQSITVVSGADYTVEITGSGSVALTGAGTGTVTAGNPVEITASTTTLTLTVTGTPSTMWAYRSDLGGMVNNPDTGTSYVPTTSAAVYQARRNHYTYNGASWANSGLLLETEARENLHKISDFSSDYTESLVTLSANVATGPDGQTSAATIIEDNSTGTHKIVPNTGDSVPTITSGVTYTFSAFVKANGRDEIRFIENATTGAYVTYNLTTGAIVNSGSGGLGRPAENMGGGWWRCSLTFTAAGTSGRIDIALSVAGSISYAGDNASGVYIYGAQFERDPVTPFHAYTPSSYMPTAGATFTRPTESLQIAAADMPWNASNVSLQMQGKMTYADEDISAKLEGYGSNVDLYLWAIDNNNFVSNQLDTFTGGSTGRVTPAQRASGTIDSVARAAGSDYSPGILVPYNIASRHGSTFINGAVDGTALTADTTPTALPDLSATDFSLGYDYMGTIGLFRAWNVDIGDAGIAEASS